MVIICPERRSQIHDIRPLNTLTVGDVNWTHCVNRSKPATNGERNTLNLPLDLSITANKVRTFRNSQLCGSSILLRVNTSGECLNMS